MTLKRTAFGALAIMLVAAAAAWSTSSEAAKKKMAAPKPQPLLMCSLFGEYKPVCASINGGKHTYGSACWADKDGARIVSQGACKAPKAHKKMAKKSMKKPAKKKM